MNMKIGAVAIAVASLALGFGAGSAMSRAARADVSAGPDGSCGTSTPCLTESNTAGGAGVKSTSSHGTGLVATTKATGSTSSNGASAVLGQDLQTTSGKGLFNFGVDGTSTFGTGVQGAGAVGVSGVATSATGIGVLASTSSSGGLLFEGSGAGIGSGAPVFSIDPYGRATFGLAQQSPNTGRVRVNGFCGSSTDMYEGYSQDALQFQVDDCGNVQTTGLVVAGGVRGYEVAALDGLASDDDGAISVNYLAADSSANVTWLYQGYSTAAGKYTVEMGDSGSIYARIFITMNEARVAQQTATGARVDTYAPQTTQPSLEDFGEAQLAGGRATVALDPKFASAIDNSVRYYVTLTPEGDCRGLYVAQRDPTNFTVRELQGGRSSIQFTYRIVAKPFGDNSPRLPASTLPYGFEHKVAPPVMRFAPPHHARITHR